MFDINSELLIKRIDESVCKYCPNNKKCELCEISIVFQTINLTKNEEE